MTSTAPSGGVKLTKESEQVLADLHVLDRNATANGAPSWTFNPCSFGGPRAAGIARRLAARGLVEVTRHGERHLRYAITPAGRSALQQGSET
jgi:hypothetical protein